MTAHYETINTQSSVAFLEKIKQQYADRKTIYLILDQASYHKSLLFKAMAESLNIKLMYLPPYSPNLNSIERLWKVMNEKVRNNRFFKSAKDFKENINHFFDNILPQIAGTLGSRINDNFQKLDHAF